MMAVVLAGGEGIRLRPLTYAIPKPLIPVGEKPILEDIISRLRMAGFDEVVLAVGYRAELLETYFQDGSAFGVRVRYVRETHPLGTAGALSLVRQQYAPDDGVLVMNGDILTRLDMRRFWQWHKAQNAALSIAVRSYEVQVPFGVVQSEGDRVLGVVEKPVQAYDVSSGIYLLEPDALAEVPDDTFIDMPELVARLLGHGKHVGAFHFSDPWLSVDRLEELEEANRLIAEWST